MRIPFEGILAAQALEGTAFPLLLSVWGNDFTFFAKKSPLVARLTARALMRADGLHPDCQRDLELALKYGFDGTKPAIVLPGNGGVRSNVFTHAPTDTDALARWGIPAGAPVVVNPRGVKPYLRTKVFFQAIPLVLAKRPNDIFRGRNDARKRPGGKVRAAARAGAFRPPFAVPSARGDGRPVAHRRSHRVTGGP